jgi:hypothetical protein
MSEELEERDRGRRSVQGLGLVLAGIGVVAVAAVVIRDEAAIFGGSLLAFLLWGVAGAVWPHDWQPEERRHHELDAVWRQMRGDADQEVGWERYAAWAEPSGAEVELSLVTRLPASHGGPSPYRREVARRLEADDVVCAAEEMEELRAEAARREAKAQERHAASVIAADQEAHEARLHEIDAAAATEQAAREAAMKQQLSAEEQAERRAQAEILARALRKP